VIAHFFISQDRAHLSVSDFEPQHKSNICIIPLRFQSKIQPFPLERRFGDRLLDITSKTSSCSISFFFGRRDILILKEFFIPPFPPESQLTPRFTEEDFSCGQSFCFPNHVFPCVLSDVVRSSAPDLCPPNTLVSGFPDTCFRFFKSRAFLCILFPDLPF